LNEKVAMSTCALGWHQKGDGIVAVGSKHPSLKATEELPDDAGVGEALDIRVRDRSWVQRNPRAMLESKTK
jgi:hypothetical protein